MFNKKLLLVIALVGAFTGAFSANQTLVPQGVNDWATYYLFNAGKDGFNLLRNNMLYHNNGPLVRLLDWSAAASNGLNGVNGTDALVFITSEVVVNGVTKLIAATAEIQAFIDASASTTIKGKQRLYLISHDGSALVGITANGFTVTAGTAVDATSETAVYPALPANETPIGAVLVKSVVGTFTPGATNWDASGVTSTFYDLYCVNSGTSVPSAATLEYPPAYAINQ